MKKTAAIALLALAIAPACRSPRLATEERTAYRADTVYITQRQTAALLVRDSVAADTAGRVTYRQRTIYRTRVRTDTLWRHRTDTVRITQTAAPAGQEKSHSQWPWLIAGAAIGAAAALRLSRR